MTTTAMIRRSEGALGRIVNIVASLQPGQRYDVPIENLRDILKFDHNGARFTEADRVLENIIGSAWTHSYQEHPSGRFVTFIRHENDGTRRYTSPDRR